MSQEQGAAAAALVLVCLNMYHFLRVCWTATVYVKVCQRRRCKVAVNATRAAVFRKTACVFRYEGMLFMPSRLFAPGTNTVPWAC